MRFTALAIEGAWLVQAPVHADERGSFSRVLDAEAFAERGLEVPGNQISLSRNPRAGTLRGLHMQSAPHAELKLVRCMAGAVFDVLVDLRPQSPSFRVWHAEELTPDNGRALYIPRGCAHGFQTLVDGSDVLYLIADPWVPEAAGGVRWNDPAFAIAWPEIEGERIIAPRDASYPDFEL